MASVNFKNSFVGCSDKSASYSYTTIKHSMFALLNSSYLHLMIATHQYCWLTAVLYVGSLQYQQSTSSIECVPATRLYFHWVGILYGCAINAHSFIHAFDAFWMKHLSNATNAGFTLTIQCKLTEKPSSYKANDTNYNNIGILMQYCHCQSA